MRDLFYQQQKKINIDGIMRPIKPSRNILAKHYQDPVPLILSMFFMKKRKVIHATQVANIADLYFKTSLKARLSIVYVETWEDQDQVTKMTTY